MNFSRNLISLTILSALLWAAPLAQAETVRIVTPKTPSTRVAYATEQLQKALGEAGYDCTVEAINAKQRRNKKDPAPAAVVELREATTAIMPKEGFTILTREGRTTVTGNDGTGVIYGVRELIDSHISHGSLQFPDSLTDQPEMVLRGSCIGVQKPYLLPGRAVYEYPYTPELFPWFYDKAQWIEYLDMLVQNRMNSLYLWNGHPFASLVKLDDYPFAIEVDDATFQLNQETYAFLTREAERRGIFVIQMFYNIIVSKPFAEHYGIKTQDRNRPINDLLSDYTRKSIAKFVEMYPNVGLLCCLGEAMDTYEDDVNWMVNTIIPGVKDGLRTLRGVEVRGNENDLPPILLRAHDTDCKMVMDAALPVYRNLYTMHKYNGESLTTYQPRGPWAKIHTDLSSLGSTHIENVHILANLEPWRWSSPDFVQKVVGAMHSVHGANALHLYPQASYWDYPYTADRVTTEGPGVVKSPDGELRLRQLYRDWMWYQVWGRYAWRQDRPRHQEVDYWNDQLARHFGIVPNTRRGPGSDVNAANQIRLALEESGEIAPKLLRRFGITEGNRQSLLLGMFCSQLVNPYKYTIYPGFYESCGPEGEKLIEWAEREWKGQPHVGELPLNIIQEVVDHGDKAAAAIDAIDASCISQNAEEFERLRNDMHCYRAFAHAFNLKVQAARRVLDYQWSHDLRYLREVAPLLEQSLDYWRQLVSLTEGNYLYCQSMQTTMRRIPIAGDGGKNKHWNELLVHYETELANFRRNLATLEAQAAGTFVAKEEKILPLTDALTNGACTLLSGPETTALKPGAVLFSNKPDATVEAFGEEMQGLTAFVVDGDKQRDVATSLNFRAKKPVNILVAYFRDDQKKYAKAPKLETDASANDYGQAEPRLAAGIHLKGMPLANIHCYTFAAGEHTLNLPKGYCLVLGVTDSEVKERNVGLAGNADTLDWLFY